MNVLLLSIGAKKTLVEAFKSSPSVSRVITTDCSPYAAGLYASDSHYIVPLMHSPEYIPTLVNLCKKENVSVLVPLNEEELFVIAENRKIFESLNILINLSSLDVISLCKDKLEFYKVLSDAGIPCVPTIKASDFKPESPVFFYPLMAKPQKGAASMGNIVISSTDDIKKIPENMMGNYILQPFIDGIEYGVDLYTDFLSGEIIQIFIKEKISMRNGETEKSRSVKNDEIVSLVKKTVEILKPKGVSDLDILYEDGTYYLLEMNPRFGGGYSHAFLSGMDYPAFLANNATGIANTPCIGEYEAGTVALKYTSSVLLNEDSLLRDLH
ncbi:MAG: ATP-grasp domain-containing protein [Lachnospiraceae bacterium]|nr:ATP-grasp domain-containing protein [Lachnospiraceae bacterium]